MKNLQQIIMLDISFILPSRAVEAEQASFRLLASHFLINFQLPIFL